MRISVVIPVKNDAAMLERCLEALAVQTSRADEIVVVDNASDDICADVARWWGVAYVFESTNGIPAAAAAGYDAATGDIIARLDADSMPPPEWISNIRELFCDVTLDGATGHGTFEGLSNRERSAANALYMRPYFRIFGALLGHPPLFGSSFAVTSSAWATARDTVHRDDPGVHDDLDLSFRLGRSCHVVVSDLLCVGISPRPFADPLAFARRVVRGVRTVARNRDQLAITK